jgi:EAL domain-containing protein (putative c-di-GMP-specific phosphodiesterase class I)
MLYGRHIVDWVSVNLSARQLGDLAPLLATVRALHNSGLPVYRLKLEISESPPSREPETIRAGLAELQAMGVGFAVDDFATGYAVRRSLRYCPLDAIKIDGEFIAQIGTAEGEALLRALLDLARVHHGAAIIAEGIETAAQRDFLRHSDCGFGQGYLFAEPMDGALLGSYALTHAASAERGRRQTQPLVRAINPRTSTGRSPAA